MKIKYFSFEENLSYYFLCLSIVLFILNYFIENVLNINGYLFGGAALLTSFFFAKKRKDISLRFFIIISIILISICYHFIKNGYVQDGFIESLLSCVFFPTLAYLSSLESNVRGKLIQFVAYTGIISFLGSILYFLSIFGNIPYPFNEAFSAEFTATGESIQLKNVSIYGNSLVFGGISLIQASCCAYLIGKRPSFLLWFLLIICAFCVFSSLARRAYVPLFLIIFYLFFDSKNTTRIFLLSVFFISILLSLALFPEIFNSILLRVTSIFNFFDNSSGNLSRIKFMLEGFKIILENPFGVGLGSLSSVGKEYETISTAVGFYTVTESFYLTIIGEIGLFQIIIIGVLLIGTYKYIFGIRYIKYLLTPFLLESIMGLSLLNPIIAVVVYNICFPEDTSNNKVNV